VRGSNINRRNGRRLAGGVASAIVRGRLSSERPLFLAAFLAGIRHPNLPLGRRDAVERAALSAFALDTSLALRNG
jgi:hypothetical protein